MKIRDLNYHSLAHARVAKKFSGKLTYVGTFNVNEEYIPSAVYHAAEPDTSKGHKEYMLLTLGHTGGHVRGMTKEQIAPFAKRQAIHCLKCDEVVWSCMRHDAAYCTCGNVMIDGGSEVVHGLAVKAIASVTYGVLDLLTGVYKAHGKDKPKDSKGSKQHRVPKEETKSPSLRSVPTKPRRKRKAPSTARKDET